MAYAFEKNSMAENPEKSFLTSLGSKNGQGNSRTWTVSGLLQAAAHTLQARFNPVRVQGEISGFSRASSGHCYFSLKDSEGQLRCAMFRRAAGLLDFAPADGLNVELRGNLGIYEPKGDLQFIVESMRHAGEGNLFEQFLRLKIKLEGEGLFATERKRFLPAFPRAIGVVTSLDGAALHDVANTLQRRASHIPVVVYPALVQGARAPAELRAALTLAFERFGIDKIDVLLMVRGGGSLEDLWAFNDEALVRLVATSPIPIISGIGHETDFTLVDFCADVRAATPTAAAEQSAQSEAAARSRLDGVGIKLHAAIEKHMQNHSQRLDEASANLGKPSFLLERLNNRLIQTQQLLSRSALNQIRNQQIYLSNADNSFHQSIKSYLHHCSLRIDQVQMRMEPLSPDLVLQRGFVWVADAKTGQPVTQAKKTKPAQALRLQFSDGTVDAKTSRPHLIKDSFLQ